MARFWSAAGAGGSGDATLSLATLDQASAGVDEEQRPNLKIPLCGGEASRTIIINVLQNRYPGCLR